MGIHHTYKAKRGERALKKASKLEAQKEKARKRKEERVRKEREKCIAEGRPYIPAELS